MSPGAAAAFASWSAPLGPTAAAILAAIVYLRGWRTLARLRPTRFPRWRLAAFLSGLAAFWAAVASPLDALSGWILWAHMTQHLVLMLLAPPLLLAGAPEIPLLRGLPRPFVRHVVGPFFTSPAVVRLGRLLTHPATGLAAMAGAMWGWHVPAAYELALRSSGWHEVEHATFLAAGLLFWWPVVMPWPSRRRWPAWTTPLYLLAGDLTNTALAAALTFSDRVVYPTYESAPRLFGLTALADQSLAGLLMWVPGSLAFLVPAAISTARLLRPAGLERARAPEPPRMRPPEPFDLLRAPLIGPFLRWRWGRRTLQAALLIAAAAVVVDGFTGAPVGAANLAGVGPWIWGRGLLVLGLLVAGNVFCMACPFTLPRELGKRLARPVRAWPKALRSKWLAAALLAVFFFAYERFDLWDRPAATAALLVGYFAAAFAVDSLFRGASFCKYVCPIGQFQFAGSLVSPLEVRVRRPEACASCTTHDCLKGNAARRGCELDLFLPHKAGNVDCTFCLDCVKACPHDAIGILPVLPGRELVRDAPRSSVGRFASRPDFGVLALVFAGAAFATAFAMVRPGNAAAFAAAVAALLVAALALVPRESRARMALAFIPLGLAMWTGHWGFHLASAALPGWTSGGPFPRIALALLDAGLLATLYAGWRVDRRPRAFAPAALVAAALWLAGFWIFLQPMPMRGMVH
jgi:cytochrome c oxidase assembly factor CtaG/polyferredoxin